MDSQILVGVGNIYAAESLFEAGIHPKRAANRVSRERYQALASTIKSVLQRAIECGGSTLRDYVNGKGQPGYFQQTLKVYGRSGLACILCQAPLREVRIAQRASCYCSHCQR